jgi:hypothetical protein
VLLFWVEQGQGASQPHHQLAAHKKGATSS